MYIQLYPTEAKYSNPSGKAPQTQSPYLQTSHTLQKPCHQRRFNFWDIIEFPEVYFRTVNVTVSGKRMCVQTSDCYWVLDLDDFQSNWGGNQTEKLY